MHIVSTIEARVLIIVSSLWLLISQEIDDFVFLPYTRPPLASALQGC